MPWITLFISLFPSIVQLVTDAEQFIVGAKKGEVKKDMVMGAVGSLVSGIHTVQPHLLTDTEVGLINQAASVAVDGIVSIANQTGIFKRTLTETGDTSAVLPGSVR